MVNQSPANPQKSLLSKSIDTLVPPLNQTESKSLQIIQQSLEMEETQHLDKGLDNNGGE